MVSVPEPQGRKRKELWMVSSTVVQPTTMAIASSGSNSDNSGAGGGGSSDGDGSDGSDGSEYTPCVVPALNY